MRILSFLRWSIVGALLALLIAPAAITLATGTQLVVVDGKSMTPPTSSATLFSSATPTPTTFNPATSSPSDAPTEACIPTASKRSPTVRPS